MYCHESSDGVITHLTCDIVKRCDVCKAYKNRKRKFWNLFKYENIHNDLNTQLFLLFLFWSLARIGHDWWRSINTFNAFNFPLYVSIVFRREINTLTYDHDNSNFDKIIITNKQSTECDSSAILFFYQWIILNDIKLSCTVVYVAGRRSAKTVHCMQAHGYTLKWKFNNRTIAIESRNILQSSFNIDWIPVCTFCVRSMYMFM